MELACVLVFFSCRLMKGGGGGCCVFIVSPTAAVCLGRIENTRGCLFACVFLLFLGRREGGREGEGYVCMKCLLFCSNILSSFTRLYI